MTTSLHAALVATLICLAPSLVNAKAFDAPNIVTISANLVTSGQPTAKALADLGSLGFNAVIYLAPSTVDDVVKEEPQLLAKQGIEFIHIPIPFATPDESHFIALSAALERLRNKKVLVHCQINLRASSLVFLHRAIRAKEDPAKAYESVAAVWSPQGAWRKLITEQLAKHGVKFEPY